MIAPSSPGTFTGGRLQGGTLDVGAREPGVYGNYNPYGAYGTGGRTDPSTTISVSSGAGSSTASASFGQVASFGQSNSVATIATITAADAVIMTCCNNPTDSSAQSLFDIYTSTYGVLGLTGSMYIQDGSTYSASLTGNSLTAASSGNEAGWEFSGGYGTDNTNGPGSYYLGSIAINATIRNLPGYANWKAGGNLDFSAQDDGNVSALIDSVLNGVTTRSQLYVEVMDGLVSDVMNTGVFSSLTMPSLGAAGTFTLAVPSMVATWDLTGVLTDPTGWTTDGDSDVGAHYTVVANRNLDCSGGCGNVPEPSSLALAVLGIPVLRLYRRRRGGRGS